MSQVVWTTFATNDADSTVYDVGAFSNVKVFVGGIGGLAFGGGTVYVLVSLDGGTNYGIISTLTAAGFAEFNTKGRAAKLKLRLTGSTLADIDAFFDVVPT